MSLMLQLPDNNHPASLICPNSNLMTGRASHGLGLQEMERWPKKAKNTLIMVRMSSNLA